MYPVDVRGNMLPYVTGYAAPKQWEENTPRIMTLTFTNVSRGRSSVRFEFTDESGRTWSMFLSDVAILMKHFVFDQGVIEGCWYVVKRGGDYGLAPHPSMLEEFYGI